MSKILIVDDELDICLMLSKYLQNLGFETQYALTLKEARLKINVYPYTLMFIDLNLTEGSGYDLMNYVHEMKLDSRIIVISAYDSEASKALEKGADFFIAKPFSIKTINAKLMQLNLVPN